LVKTQLHEKIKENVFYNNRVMQNTNLKNIFALNTLAYFGPASTAAKIVFYNNGVKQKTSKKKLLSK
jgi:hypothetical protein